MGSAILEAPKAKTATQAKPDAVFNPKTVRISSKRQITIPAKLYEKHGFTEYAWIEETEDGLLIKPIQVESEDVSLYVLRRLVENGYEGEELLAKYEEIYPMALDFHKKIEEAEEDIREGRVYPAEYVQQKMREKYGLHRD